MYFSVLDVYCMDVIVCFSAGCGRTGTIIVIDYVCNLLKFGVSFSFLIFVFDK